MASTRGHISVGFFADLHKRTTADFYCSKSRRKTIQHGRLLDVERVVASRKKQVSSPSLSL